MDYKEKISQYYTSEHQKSQQKIKYGIVCIIAIPLIFLILMFTMKSSKLVYLILWIAALFIISVYLIYVEYKDYTMQKQLKELIGEDENQPLIELPNLIELACLENDKLSKQNIKDDKISEKKQKEMNVYAVQKLSEIQKEYEIIAQEEHQKIDTKDRMADLEKELQMLREIAQLRTQLGMGDYSSLYKENDNVN